MYSAHTRRQLIYDTACCRIQSWEGCSKEPMSKGKRPQLYLSSLQAYEKNINLLLSDLRRAATKARIANASLRLLVIRCYNNQISASTILSTMERAGWSTSYARSFISLTYTQFGIRRRKQGAGRKTSGVSIRLANYAVKFCRGDRKAAAAGLLGAYRHLKSKTRNTVTE